MKASHFTLLQSIDCSHINIDSVSVQCLAVSEVYWGYWGIDKIYVCPVNVYYCYTTLYDTLENNGYDLPRILAYASKINL